jgi:hypothetical protein
MKTKPLSFFLTMAGESSSRSSISSSPFPSSSNDPPAAAVMTTGLMTMIPFQGNWVVRVAAFNGERWKWRVTAPPPFTARSNLKRKRVRFEYFTRNIKCDWISTHSAKFKLVPDDLNISRAILKVPFRENGKSLSFLLSLSLSS